MNRYISLSANRGEDFTYASSEDMISRGVPESAVLDVMIGMADGLEEQGYYVEMEIEYV